jgi:nanoRNase/pAp phosphatase (c-di-AMP/oligoRNAs hydrolase)
MGEQKFRLVTRSDFDGLVCAVLLRELGLIEEIKFVHPKDMQDGTVAISAHDITTNLPYAAGVHLAFDHHLSETFRLGTMPTNYIIDPDAPSASRVLYKYYGGPARFPQISEEMLAAVDKADSAQFTEDDILHPQGWVLLHFLMDPRTGLGRFHDFRISNYNLMMELIGHCQKYSVAEILELPDVQERVDIYDEYQEKFKDQLRRCSKVHNNLVVLDLRDEDVIYPGNRFMIYVLFPQCNISIHVLWGKQQQNIVFAAGKSIINRTSRTNIGELTFIYGGGGHANAGTCQTDIAKADDVLKELIEKITAQG